MLIHIGDNNYLFKKDIIAILDKKSVDATKKTREFIDKMIKSDCLVGSLDINTKSYIVAKDNKETKIYTSKISSKALSNRSIFE